MKIQFTKSTPITRSLLTLTLGSTLACLPLGYTLAQDPATAPAAPAPANTETPGGPVAATAPAPPAMASAKLTHQEMEFVKKAGAGNAAEVKVAQLALTNADSQEVKDFATQMIKDHGDANTELGGIAKSHDIAFPPAEMEKQKMMYAKLSKLHGAEFDKAYVKGMVADHEKDLAAYKMEKHEAKDADLKEYVDKTEKVVAGHLTMIKDIHAKMMGAKKS